MSTGLAVPHFIASLAMSRSFLVRWMPTFLGFPAGGALTTLLTGPVNAPLPAMHGGLLAGVVIGGAQ